MTHGSETIGGPSPPGIKSNEERLADRLRTFLQDTLKKNKLDKGFEIGDDELILALEMTLDDYNHTPPFENRTFQTFPSLKIMIYGGAIEALTMAAISSERNELPFQVGNISTAIKNRAPGYLAIIGRLEAKYEEMKSSTKITLNMEQAFGVTDSPYGYTQNFQIDN